MTSEHERTDLRELHRRPQVQVTRAL
jgi:hypothetical protein